MEHARLRAIWSELPKERLRSWKKFREGLNELSKEDALDRTAKLWGTVPLENRTIDPYDSTKWLTPWEMLYGNHFCSYSRALGIYYKLLYSNQNFELDINLIECQKLNDIMLVIIVDNNIVLNYIFDDVEDWNKIQKHCRILQNFYLK